LTLTWRFMRLDLKSQVVKTAQLGRPSDANR